MMTEPGASHMQITSENYLNFPPIFYKHGRIDKHYL